MKIAYLILAHHQSAHVARMVRRLDDGEATFFIHVDAKTDIAPFRAALTGAPVLFVAERLVVNWGGWNMVRATLRLLAQALASSEGFGRFQLLSDSCFPIKPTTFIRDRLSSSDRNFITINHRLDEHSVFHWWVAQYHLPDHLKLHTFERLPPYTLCRKLVGRLAPRRPPAGLQLCKGWQWWCLTRAGARYVLDFVRERPDVVRFFRFVRIPDETFFQSILASSPLADTLEPGFGNSDLTGNHYIRWAQGRPVVLTEPVAPDLARTPACFARKFSETDSAGLLDMLGTRAG
jgi:hypothetical protein